MASEHKCKKYRTIKECNNAPERCGWVPHKKCLPLPETTGINAQNNAKPNMQNQHVQKCKTHKTIKACNDSIDDCHWVPRLKCLPGKSGTGNKPGPIQPEKVKETMDEWLAWYCKVNPKNTVYCMGGKPISIAEAKAGAIRELNRKCIDMMDPITAEEFNESKPIEYLHSIVPLGAKDRSGKQHCFDAPFMLDIIFQQMLLGDVKDPMTNQKMSIGDINAIIDANLALRKMAPTKTKPAKVFGISTHVEKHDGYEIDRKNNLSLITLNCNGSPFTSLGKTSKKVHVEKYYPIPDFDMSPTIPGFTYGSMIEALTILVNNGRVFHTTGNLNQVFENLKYISKLNPLFNGGGSKQPYIVINRDIATVVHRAIQAELRYLAANSKSQVTIPNAFR